jgi:hypothetical protein
MSATTITPVECRQHAIECERMVERAVAHELGPAPPALEHYSAAIERFELRRVAYA